jgi:hypothetical protein
MRINLVRTKIILRKSFQSENIITNSLVKNTIKKYILIKSLKEKQNLCVLCAIRPNSKKSLHNIKKTETSTRIKYR